MKRFIAFLLGIVAQLTFITAPIHELGHWSLAILMGVPATMGWNTTTFHGGLSDSQFFALSWAGVGFETGFFALLAMAFGRKGKKVASTFCLAAALTAFISAGTYTDLAAIQYRGLVGWYWIGMIVFSCVVWKVLRGAKAPSGGGKTPQVVR